MPTIQTLNAKRNKSITISHFMQTMMFVIHQFNGTIAKYDSKLASVVESSSKS